jgi:hypothetical protein
MSRMLQFLIVTALLFYAGDRALYYGGIWQSRTYPTDGVEVIFDDGRVLHGRLTREWDGRFTLLSNDGTTSTDVGAYRVMTFPAPNAERLKHPAWRSSLPASMLLALYCAYCFFWVRGTRLPRSFKAEENSL